MKSVTQSFQVKIFYDPRRGSDSTQGHISLPRQWSNTGTSFLERVVDALSLSTFKNHLDNAINMLWPLVSPKVVRDLNEMIIVGPFQAKHSTLWLEKKQIGGSIHAFRVSLSLLLFPGKSQKPWQTWKLLQKEHNSFCTLSAQNPKYPCSHLPQGILGGGEEIYFGEEQAANQLARKPCSLRDWADRSSETSTPLSFLSHSWAEFLFPLLFVHSVH